MKNNIVKMNPLTPMQNGMLYHSLLNEDGANYYQQMCFYLEGEIETDLLKESWQKIIDRYEIFKTNFIWKGVKTPVQVVLDKKVAAIAEYDITDLAPLEQEKYISQFKKDDLQNKFDFQKGELNRLTLIKLAQKKYFICWTCHHILLDGWSSAIVLGDFFQIYHLLIHNLPLPSAPEAQFSDYLNWLKKQKTEEGLAFWQDKLKDLTDPTLFSAATKPNQNEVISTVATKEIISSIEKTNEIKNFCQENNITINAFIQTAWGILLQKYNNLNQSCCGMTVAGRPAELKNVEKIVGLFINTIPLLIKTEEQDTLRELLVKVNEELIQIRRYEYISLAEIQQLNSHLDKMFDSLIVFENYPIDSVENQTNLDFSITFDSMFELTTYDLCMEVVIAEKMTFRLAYNKQILHPETIENALNHLNLIIDTMLTNADQLVKKLTLVTEHEKQKLLYEWNHTELEYPKTRPIHQLFEEQVKRTPEHLAVVFAEEQLTYRELNERANQLAALLRRKGCGSTQIVGMMIERSIEMIIGILGILKAGAACLPIDPEYPQERIEYMLLDSKPAIVLIKGQHKKDISYVGEWINLDEKEWVNSDCIRDIAYDEVKPHIEQLLYVIYTSGSTGKPKGVMLNQHNLVNLLYYEYSSTNIDFQSKVLQFNTISFDVSFQEIFSTLLAGGQLYLISQEQKENLPELFRLIEEKQIEILFLPVVFLKFVFAEKEWIEKFPHTVKHIITAGEQLIISNGLRNYLKKNHVYLHNHYGPSETHVVTTLTLNPDEDIPELPSIGKPIANTRIYILDHQLNLQPVGVAGELYIAGDAVGKGYLNRPELTEERFCNQSFSFFNDAEKVEERIYKTGDLARWLPDGNVEFLGRTDQQVKIRGFRIEPGEIETQLLNHVEIKAAVVVDRSDDKGDKYLAAYFVAEQELSVQSLKEYLKKELPDYMIPSYFVQLTKLPLTPSGKINKLALPDPQENIQIGVEYLAPSDETETVLAKIWSEILGMQKIGLQDDFFGLGGHSLKATQLVSRIFKEFNVEITLREVFKNPTLKRMADLIKSREATDYGVIEAVEENKLYPEGCYPVSSAQKRLFVLKELEGEGIGYNLPLMLVLEGKLDEERFEKALLTLIKRHEALRTSFGVIDGQVVQRIHQDIEFRVEKITLDEIKDTGMILSQVQTIIMDFIKPFDLSKAPLLRVGLLELEKDKYLVLSDMHHIISDGTSLGIFFTELFQLYEGRMLPEVRIQYKDFASWQNKLFLTEEFKEQEEYWLQTFADEVPVLNLSTDYPRPKEKTFKGSTYEFCLSIELSEKVNKLALAEGTTLYMVLLAVFNVLLAKYSGQEDIVVGSPIAGRRHADLEQMIGMFVNTLAIRNYPGSQKTFREFLREVKENSLKAYDNQDYQFEMLVDQLNLERDLSRNALFDVVFTLQNINDIKIQLKDLSLKPYFYDYVISKFDLTLNAFEENQRIHFGLEYSSELFMQKTIERMSKHFVQIFSAVVDNSELSLRDIRMITPEEQEQLVVEFNQTKVFYPEDKTIVELFEEQVMMRPDNVAISFAEQELTYQELNQKANQLGRRLRAMGIKSEQIVGIIVEPSVEMAIGILGILKAGGAYLPIDPQYPVERIEFMLIDSQVNVLLTQGDWVNPDNLQIIEIINLKDESQYPEEQTNIASAIKPTDLAYIIYTSGSTGQPKGVMIEHRNVFNTLYWRKEEYQFSPADRSLQLFSNAFDGFVTSFFTPLISGAQVVLLNADENKDVLRIKDIIRSKKITHFICVPSLYAVLLEVLSSDDVESLKMVTLAGEMVKAQLIEKTKELSTSLELVNEYGPTENSVTTTIKRNLQLAETITIGKPIVNTFVYILDKDLNLVPIGVPGEICISGEGLARGYLHKHELAKEKFIPNPFNPGTRLYRTGDLARWLLDGDIEFIGRIDNQVKIRGYRIELTEIEKQLFKLKQIKEVCVMEKQDNDNYLCAYIVKNDEIVEMDLRKELAKSLPEYMIPAQFVFLDKMPININGKIDRQALVKIKSKTSVHREYVAPETELEKQLTVLWSEILGIEQVGIDDNFFELGGHSLKAIAFIVKARTELHVELPLRQLMKQPTIRELAEYINNTKTVEARSSASDQVVLLRSGKETSQHLFLVHGGEGEVSAYLELCENLTEDINCWGIRAEKLENFAPSNRTIEEIAYSYIEKIKSVQPEGPYYLAGWCIGGTIVFEMVNQLEERGEKVACAILIDSPAPEILFTQETRKITYESEIDWIQQVIPIKQIVEEISEATDIEQIWSTLLGMLQKNEMDHYKYLIPDYLVDMIPNFAELGLVDVLYYLNMLKTLGNARAFYIPTRRVNTQIHFFKANQSEIAEESWNAYCSMPIKTYCLAGDHYSIFKAPEVTNFAHMLSAVLMVCQIKKPGGER